MHVPRLKFDSKIESLFVTKMLAMALLLHGALLGGVGDEAGGVDGSGEGTWTLATPLEGFLAAQVSVSLFRAFPRGASWVSRENQSALAERRVEDHFNTAGQRRHNEAWAGKLSNQKRTAALIRSSGAPVPAKLAKKIREDDVMSVTETESDKPLCRYTDT